METVMTNKEKKHGHQHPQQAQPNQPQRPQGNPNPNQPQRPQGNPQHGQPHNPGKQQWQNPKDRQVPPTHLLDLY
jgi:hypothetical protein